MKLTNEQYRKMAEAAGYPVVKYASDGPHGRAFITLDDGEERPFFWRSNEPVLWSPDIDLNQLFEWLDAVEDQRGWTRSEHVRHGKLGTKESFYAFAAHCGVYLDCNGLGNTPNESAVTAILEACE